MWNMSNVYLLLRDSILSTAIRASVFSTKLSSQFFIHICHLHKQSHNWWEPQESFIHVFITNHLSESICIPFQKVCCLYPGTSNYQITGL